MSLVGNFAFNNYDQTNAQGGVSALGGNAFVRRNSQAQAEDSNESGERPSSSSGLTRTISRTLSLGGRRQSVSSPTDRGTQGHTPGYSAGYTQSHVQDRSHDGIHNGTYYPDGIPPESEKQRDLSDSTPVETAESASSYDDPKDHEVAHLARTLTRQSTYSQIPNGPFEFEKESDLDPNGPNFKARKWVKSMVKLNQSEPEKNPGRTSGIAFRNLNVHGSGAATDYQKSVGNIWLGAVGLVRQLFGVGQRRIDILRDFEGLVHSGEMLVVLGPPGSGTSTNRSFMTHFLMTP